VKIRGLKMAKTVAIGIQDFEKLIVEDCFYIDKTYFIREWWNSKDEVTLITRPRRFGKTLNMSMLECFFSNKYEGRGDLFEGLNISASGDLSRDLSVICGDKICNVRGNKKSDQQPDSEAV